MLYDRINNLRLKRSPPDSDLNGGHDTDLRNKTNGRDVEDDGIRTVHNITASKIMPSTTHRYRAFSLTFNNVATRFLGLPTM